MIGMSNAPIPSPIQQPLATSSSFMPGAGFGEDVIAGANPQTGLTALAYPSDLPKYMITFTISQYIRTDLNSIGQFTPAGYPGIILPLPSQLIDTNHVNWAEVEIGTLAGTAVNGAKQVVNGNWGAALGNLIGAGTIGGLNAAANLGQGTSLSGLNPATGFIQGSEALLGVAPNQFVTMLMRGPTYKRHRFTWTLSPQNYPEANNLREIIRTFKNAMSPNYYTITQGAGPVLWAFPKIFRIRIYPNSLFMYKFKPAICDYFVVNYMPGGRGAFTRDISGAQGANGQNAPESVQIQANFIELEYWVEGNFSADNDPDYNYSNNPAGTLSNLTGGSPTPTSPPGTIDITPNGG